MRRPDHDIIVLGAGPSGATAATILARQGWRVVLIDPHRKVAPRLESLPVNGLPLAGSLGLFEAIRGACVGRAAAMQMLWRGQVERLPYGDGGPWLVDRTRLHEALLQTAIAAGATLVTAPARAPRDLADRVSVSAGRGNLSAGLVIDARGRAAMSARGRRRATLPDLVALPFQGTLRDPLGQPLMQIEALAEAWLWACRLTNRIATGALFVRPARLSGLDAAGRRDLLSRALATTRLVPEVENLDVGTPQPAMLRHAAEAMPSKRIIRIGDAALARDPIASHGLVHAMRSAAQAAAAANTILDPDGETDAAISFVRETHRRATITAIAATISAYRDQSLFRTPFWETPPPDTGPVSEPQAPSPAGPLTLAAPLHRAATLDQDRICWTEALSLPASGTRAARIGPFSARQMADLLEPPAGLATLAARMARTAAPDAVAAILRHLLAERALVAQPGNAAPQSL